MQKNKKTVQEIALDKEQKIMQTVAWRAGYYRENPQRFVQEVLGIQLKLFQKIMIWAMMHYNYVMYIAARGQGKSYLTALFCCVRCILYPQTKIIVSSKTLKQANQVLLKIQDDFMKTSWFLRSQIAKCSIGQNDASIYFKNGSWIKTRTSTDNSRSARANILICDEYRMVDENILNTVLRKFLTSPRQPKYLSKPEYAHLQERNKEIYMSSAWFKASWAYKKAQSYTLNFFDDKKKYFICGLPYQVSVKQNLLLREQIKDEMSEADFNDLVWQMEMETLWWGNEGNGLFKYEDIHRCRKIKSALLPLKFYKDKSNIPAVGIASKRVMSVDVALMASNRKKDNDATAIIINDAVQKDDISYHSNFVYQETFEGLKTDELGILIMRYFYKYKCTDLVLDTNGIGLGVYDFVCKDQYDSETGDTYKALTCINDNDMAIRCKVKDANKVVWSIKATEQFNSDICLALYNGIQSGRISMLQDEHNIDEYLEKNIKGYNRMTPADKALIKMPYAQTTMLEYELIKLQTYVKNKKVKVKERSGMRKDRYSSAAYNYWCVCQMELNLKPVESTQSLLDAFKVRRGSYKGRKI